MKGRKAKTAKEKVQQSEVGTALRQIRRQRGLTIDQVAENIGLSRSTMFLIEKGYQFPTLDRLYEFAAYYEIQASSILRLAEVLKGNAGTETNLLMRSLIKIAYYEKHKLPKRLKRSAS